MEKIEVNEHGGMGTDLDADWEDLDARALRAIAGVLAYGRKKYARENWRACDVREHLKHAIGHAYGFLELVQQRVEEGGSEAYDELSHFACRAVMAMAVFLQEPRVRDLVPKGLSRAA